MTAREEYPRPQFVRNNWLNLNGEWDFQFDDGDDGLKAKWYQKPDFGMKIVVPFVYQSRLSGINCKDFHDIVWYTKSVTLEDEWLKGRVLLNFGAVDYKADVWVNGEHVTTHEGGHVSFSVEVTNLVKKENVIVVRVQDYTRDLELPRGKQYWKPNSESIFYTRSTGIWQTVWLEAVPKTYLKKVWFTPDIDKKTILIEYEVDGKENADLGLTIMRNGTVLANDRFEVINQRGKKEIWLDQAVTINWNHNESLVWSPESPNLFDIKFKLYSGDTVTDEVSSYFAMRKVSIENGLFMLNNRPYYQKLLLDQGYWQESLLTAPSDEAFKEDIRLAKAMGFNGVRKHQKIEDPRFLYWADKMGLLVWGEMANAFVYSRQYVDRVVKEWMEVVRRDYNHPCIVVWVPLNESWGVDGILHNKDEQAHSVSMYYITKSIDQTRPVISNDGWEHTKSDILTIHDYEWRKEILKERYRTLPDTLNCMPSCRRMFAEGWEYENQPIIVSEMSGISYRKGNQEGWGYSYAVSDEDFILRYYNVVSAMLESPLIQGFVVTQLTDLEQEMNGLLTYDRKPKVDVEILRKINDGKWTPSAD